MTPSKNLSLSSDVELEARVRTLCRGLIDRPSLHARFLNTLSLLEHIGGRKILLSQGGAPSEEVLRHLAEETRHAHFFRRHAERLAGRSLTYADADAIAPASARMYFGRLDAQISREVSGRLPYLYVTLTVELRADWFYRLYESLLRSCSGPLSLQNVLAEEESHLRSVQAALEEEDAHSRRRIPRFMACEEKLFYAWLDRLERAAFLQAAAGPMKA